MSHPHPVDVHVGERIKLRRISLRMSQERLGHALGLTFQQVQKYERGANRVGASRLFEVSRVLDVPMSFFFEGAPEPSSLPDTAQTRAPPSSIRLDLLQAAAANDGPERAQMLQMIQAYLRITDPTVRQRVVELLTSMTPD